MVSVPSLCEHSGRCHQSFSKRELLCFGCSKVLFISPKANESVFSRRVMATTALFAQIWNADQLAVAPPRPDQLALRQELVKKHNKKSIKTTKILYVIFLIRLIFLKKYVIIISVIFLRGFFRRLRHIRSRGNRRNSGINHMGTARNIRRPSGQALSLSNR